MWLSYLQLWHFLSAMFLIAYFLTFQNLFICRHVVDVSLFPCSKVLAAVSTLGWDSSPEITTKSEVRENNIKTTRLLPVTCYETGAVKCSVSRRPGVWIVSCECCMTGKSALEIDRSLNAVRVSDCSTDLCKSFLNSAVFYLECPRRLFYYRYYFQGSYALLSLPLPPPATCVIAIWQQYLSPSSPLLEKVVVVPLPRWLYLSCLTVTVVSRLKCCYTLLCRPELQPRHFQ